MNCPDCGHPNANWRSHCEKCSFPLPGALPDRPQGEEWEEEEEWEEKPKRKSKRKRKHKPDETQCPHCGYVGKLTHRGTCASCDAWLAPDRYTRSPVPQKLPLFSQHQTNRLIFGAIMMGLVAIFMLGVNFRYFFLFMGIAVGLGALALKLGTMKKWGRNLAIVLAIIGLLYSLHSTSIEGLAGCGFFLLWLLSNDHRFSD